MKVTLKSTVFFGAATIILVFYFVLVSTTNISNLLRKSALIKETVLFNGFTTENEENNERRALLGTLDKSSTVNISKLKMPHSDRNTFMINRNNQISSEQQTFDNAPISSVPTIITKDKTVSGERIYKIAMYKFEHKNLKKLYREMDMQKCFYYKNCEIVEQTTFEGDYIEADAVVFENAGRAEKLPKHRDENQVFIFLSEEARSYFSRSKERYDFFPEFFFNWTMTYRVDSSIPYLYGSIVPKFFSIQDMEPKPINSFLDIPIGSTSYIDDVYDRPVGIPGKNYSLIFRKKTQNALWLVSNCRAPSNRDQYIKELQKYMEINVSGDCNKNSTIKCPIYARCENLLSEKFKFYMAFENSLCRDYITEKAFNWFQRDIVIVVRGARHYSTYLPRGTYIDTNDFATPRELAVHLNRLGSNEIEYTNILKRTDSYKVITRAMHSKLSYCHLCSKLNNKERGVVPDIYAWWTNEMCLLDDKIKDL